MKLFVLALLALSCVQLVIAKLPPFRTLELKIPSPPKAPSNPFDYLIAAIPPLYLSTRLFTENGRVLEVPGHPELLVFFPEKDISPEPGHIDDIPFIYLSRTTPKSNDKPDPVGRLGKLIPEYGRDLLSFTPLIPAELKGHKYNDPEYNPPTLYLKAAVPPLFGLEVHGNGRYGRLASLSNGDYAFDPKITNSWLHDEDPRPYWLNITSVEQYQKKGKLELRVGDLPRFYLKTTLKKELYGYDGPIHRGRLIHVGLETFAFKPDLQTTNSKGPHRILDPPGKPVEPTQIVKKP